MKRVDSKPLTRDMLHRLYVEEGRGVLEVARIVKRRNDTVLAALKGYGLIQPVTKDWMTEHYVQQGKSVDEIASMLRCTESNVRYYLRSYGIPQRYKPRGRKQIARLHDPAWLYAEYVSKRRSAASISDELGCNQTSVVRALMRYDVSRAHSATPLWRAQGQVRYFTQKQRRVIFTRDGYACRLCGSVESLETHHIIPVSRGGTNATDNGITLCVRCHDSVQGHETAYVARFQAMVQGLSA